MPGFELYTKNMKPGLTEVNREKQVVFAKHVHNYWGLPRETLILWVHSDEKWFHALVPRSNAKACEELGIPKQSYSVHHKSHVGKVMGHATVGFLFRGSPENGGKGFLIGLHRCEGFKVPLCDVRHSSKDPVTGRTRYRGNPIKHHKGVPYKVDCNVTGSDVGTATDPKFALSELWAHTLLPALDALTAEGAPAHGATVVFQEDNAGPHNCRFYRTFLRDEFSRRGWHVELQAPQGPYTNVLDLSVFPAMSKRHSERLQMYNNTEANKELVWKTARNVWDGFSSSEVARAFVLAYRILRLIIDENGFNHWLSDGTPHCDVRRDFYDFEHGIAPANGPRVPIQYEM